MVYFSACARLNRYICVLTWQYPSVLLYSYTITKPLNCSHSYILSGIQVIGDYTHTNTQSLVFNWHQMTLPLKRGQPIFVLHLPVQTQSIKLKPASLHPLSVTLWFFESPLLKNCSKTHWTATLCALYCNLTLAYRKWSHQHRRQVNFGCVCAAQSWAEWMDNLS